MSRKILITGSSGFIASYLIPELVKLGDAVVGFDLAPPIESIASLGDYYRGDLADPRDLYRIMLIERPTHVVHLASILAGPCEDNPGRGYAVNFGSALTLLDAGKAADIQSFVLASSISVFGRGLAEPVPDDAIKEPETIYGKTKLASEQLLDWYRKKQNMNGIALRFPWVFGPGRERGITALYSSKLLDKVARRESLVIDNPEEKGDWLYVKDVVRSLIMALTTRNQKQVAYNIMGGAYSIREALTIAREIVPESKITFSDTGTSKSPYPAEYSDASARKELGWKPAYTLREAIADHIAIVQKG